VRALRQPGEPLERIGQEFELGDIAVEDWIPGLRDRFAEGGVKIEDRELFEVVQASGGHPRRTMLIASYVYPTALAQPDRIATNALVEFAIRDARRDRAWN